MKKTTKRRWRWLVLPVLTLCMLMFAIPVLAESVTDRPAPTQSKVTKVKLVASNRVRIDWTKSKNADGYLVLRKINSGVWKKISDINSGTQTFCYDYKIAKGKTYSYTVKAYQKNDGGLKYAPYNTKGKKIKFSSVTVKPKQGNFSSGTVYGPSLPSTQRAQVQQAVNRFCKLYITSDMSAIEKVMVAQYYMDVTCTYAATWAKNYANTAWGSLVYKNEKGLHEAQCSGYARGFKALCDAMGVPCRYVHANSKSANPSHQWCEVKIDNKWYIQDPQGNMYGWYFFLLSGPGYQSLTGMRWDTGSYPKVSSTEYSREKLSAAASGYKVLHAAARIQKYR